MKRPATHGGRRKGAGRPPLPRRQRRVPVSLRLAPGKLVLWDQLAKRARTTRTGWLEDQLYG